MSNINRVEVYKKYDGHCAYCGNPIPILAMQVDHIIPQSDFILSVRNQKNIPKFLWHLTELDLNHIDNLNPACRVCNKWKSSHHLELFRHEISQQIKRLNEYNANYRMAKKYNQLQETESPIKFYYEQH